MCSYKLFSQKHTVNDEIQFFFLVPTFFNKLCRNDCFYSLCIIIPGYLSKLKTTKKEPFQFTIFFCFAIEWTNENSLYCFILNCNEAGS